MTPELFLLRSFSACREEKQKEEKKRGGETKRSKKYEALKSRNATKVEPAAANQLLKCELPRALTSSLVPCCCLIGESVCEIAAEPDETRSHSQNGKRA